MRTWNICVDGRPYSRVNTDNKADADAALQQWNSDLGWMRAALEAASPGVVITAERYVSSRLDHYGTKRGG